MELLQNSKVDTLVITLKRGSGDSPYQTEIIIPGSYGVLVFSAIQDIIHYTLRAGEIGGLEKAITKISE